jgi:broad specificity phosphatase PhoE
MILVRHGQTEFNRVYAATRQDPGIEDPALTRLGREQAEAAAEALAAPGPGRAPVTRLLASPYTRTLETAAIIAERLALPVSVEPLVREHASFVCDVGTPRETLAAAWPGLAFSEMEECWWAPNGEDLAAVRQRCAAFCAKAAAMADWRSTAVVTHWGVILSLNGPRAVNGALIPFDPTRPLPEIAAAGPPAA